MLTSLSLAYLTSKMRIKILPYLVVIVIKVIFKEVLSKMWRFVVLREY